MAASYFKVILLQRLLGVFESFFFHTPFNCIRYYFFAISTLFIYVIDGDALCIAADDEATVITLDFFTAF